MGESVRFDRAAEFYDRTRAMSDEAMARTVELLASELRDRGRVLEIGVGTGLLALPLREGGVQLAGLDISEPMLGKLVEKAGGKAPFPLVLGDATRLPFRDSSFGGAVIRHVLHLIPLWHAAVDELIRTLRGGSVVVVNHGGFSETGLLIRRRVEELSGRTLGASGLDWHAWRELEDKMAASGARRRTLESIVEHDDWPLGSVVDDIEKGVYSWTWPLSDDERASVASRLRPWLESRFGPLDAPFRYETLMVWHAYDLA